MKWEDAVRTYASLTTELAQVYKNRATLQADSVRVRNEAYVRSTASTATGRRDESAYAAHKHDVEIARLDGEVLALTTQLRYMDQYIAFVREHPEPEEVSDG